MKKTLLTLGFIGAVAMANAQTGQGTWMLGGGAGFNSSTTVSTNTLPATPGAIVLGDPSSFSWNLSPKLGYFVIDKLAVGAEINLTGTSSTNPGFLGLTVVDYKSSSMSWTLAPFGRYYFMFGDNMGIYAHVGIGFGGVSGSYDQADPANPTVLKSVDMDPTSVFMYEVGPGFALFLNESVALEAGLIYSASTSTTDHPAVAPMPAWEGKSVTAGFGLNLGFAIHFGAK